MFMIIAEANPRAVMAACGNRLPAAAFIPSTHVAAGYGNALVVRDDARGGTRAWSPPVP